MCSPSYSAAHWHNLYPISGEAEERVVLEASYYLIDPCLYMLNPVDVYEEALITFRLLI